MTVARADGTRVADRHAGVDDEVDVGTSVTVAILTYLRPADLRRCLDGVMSEVVGLRRAAAVDAEILVVDNDPAGSAEEVVTSGAPAWVRCVVEPSPGISAGRNRALRECAQRDLLAFIDDDEVPQPGWLLNLIKTQQQTAASAVAGRVVSQFEGPLDPWVVASRLFERPPRPTGSNVGVAATNNLLLDLRKIRELGLQFDDRFGISGGGDSLFTRSLAAAGGMLVWCDEAVVTDHVPFERMSRRWVISRSRRMANTEIRVDLAIAGGPARRFRRRVTGAGRGLLRMASGGAMHLVGRVSKDESHQARGMRTLSRGVGMVAGSAGVVLHEYRRRTSSGIRHRLLPRLSASSDGDLTVLVSFPHPRPTTNPYIVMLAESVARVPGIQIRYFSWRRAILGRYHVFHAHWPEALIGGPAGPKKAARQVLFALMLVRLRLTRTPVVRTIHNLRPHEGKTRIENALLVAAERRTALQIGLNDQTPPAGVPTETILHGHYRDWFDGLSCPASDPGTIVMPGLIRQYKNVPALIKAFRAIDSSALTLRIVGQPADSDLARSLIRLAVGDKRIVLRLRFLPDREFAEEVGRAELVVLPYTDMFNSASALMALSFDRPVLVPDNEINRRLADEVGPGWVFCFSGNLAPADITDTLARLRGETHSGRPDLSGRNWDRVGDDHVKVYRQALEATGRSSELTPPIVHAERHECA